MAYLYHLPETELQAEIIQGDHRGFIPLLQSHVSCELTAGTPPAPADPVLVMSPGGSRQSLQDKQVYIYLVGEHAQNIMKFQAKVFYVPARG